MATRKGINISGHYVVSISAVCLFIQLYMCTLHSKKLKDRTESNFILFLKLNDHPTRCSNFGFRRIHPNGCKFDLFYLFFN